jgi:hypothetical protein
MYDVRNVGAEELFSTRALFCDRTSETRFLDLYLKTLSDSLYTGACVFERYVGRSYGRASNEAEAAGKAEATFDCSHKFMPDTTVHRPMPFYPVDGRLLSLLFRHVPPRFSEHVVLHITNGSDRLVMSLEIINVNKSFTSSNHHQDNYTLLKSNSQTESFFAHPKAFHSIPKIPIVHNVI